MTAPTVVIAAVLGVVELTFILVTITIAALCACYVTFIALCHLIAWAVYG